MVLEEVRWGIIGCGDVTEVKSGPAFQKVQHSKLVAVMRRNGVLAEDYAKRHHVPHWYTDADELINTPEVNAIYIATPPAFHKEYTLKAARAGKAVYVEKPMSVNYQDCLEMIEACKASSVPLFVAYYRRALPRFTKIKEIIGSGLLGEIRFVTSTQYRPAGDSEKDQNNLPWRVQPEIAGGGLFFDLASHTLDILNFLLGKVVDAKGFTSNQGGLYKAEDMVSGTYLFGSGAHGVGAWCFNASHYLDRNEIVGSKGRLTFSTFGSEPVQFESENHSQEWTFDSPKHIQQPLIQAVVEELTGQGACPSNGITAARTNWLMDKITANPSLSITKYI